MNGKLWKIFIWIFILFLIYIAFELARKILGGSLSFEDLVIGLLLSNLGFSFYLYRCIGKLDSKLPGHVGWHRGMDSKKH